ncbi:MAG: hypothetical protein KAS82_09420 [Bacteroidales bacterium]|nr:hypothetical protein [Bacteroidales bacterium]
MKKYIIALSVLFLALTINAQEVIWKMTYDVGIPFSSTKEFTNQVSWRGLSLYFDRFVGDNLAVGMGFSWSTFVEKESDSDYQRENILLHGTQVRYINNIPLTARISWYQPIDMMELFGSIGVGTAWQETRREIGTFAFVGNYWQFALVPEVGMIFPVGQSYLTAKVRYVQAFKTSEAPDLSYMSVGVGVAW